MAQFKSYDACRNVCSTSSTGALTLGDNITGAQSIKAKMSSGDTAKFYFRKGSQWISFLGTFTSPDQLARTRIIDGSGGLATNVDFAAGTGEVAIDVSAEDLDIINTIDVTLTSAATFDIGAVYALRIRASGTTGPVTSLGTVANKFKIVRWAGATLTCNTTSLILIGLANGATRVTAAGDWGVYGSDGSGNWTELVYQKADGSALVAAAAPIPAGTLMLFQQTAAPTGWTKQTTHNDKALRVVSGTASSGGSSAFSTVFGKTATDNITLATANLAAHAHPIPRGGVTAGASLDGLGGTNDGVYNTASTGSGTGFTAAIDLRVQYVDLIIASKD